MGLTRLLLALSVVLDHSGTIGQTRVLLDGPTAVRLFYLISGFLISYVLVEAKTYANPLGFYINRYLRLYPVYAAVAILTAVAMVAVGSKTLSLYGEIPTGAKALMVAVNCFIFGQDWVMFLAIRDGALVLTSNFNDSVPKLHQLLLLPQAWTLGLELAFYALAPFSLSRPKVILGLLTISLAVRLALIHLGVALQDPWTYRFFPGELSLFLLGALAHRYGLPFFKQRFSADRLRVMSRQTTLVSALVLVSYGLIPDSLFPKDLAIVIAALAILPLLFLHQFYSTSDRSLGELSYPVYMGHLLAINISHSIIRITGFDTSKNPIGAILDIAFALGFAVLLNRWVATPCEALRKRIKQWSASQRKPA